MTMITSPDRLNIDKTDRRLYEQLDKEPVLLGKTRGRKDQFLLAMSIGYKSGMRLPIKSKEGFVLTKDLNAEDYALIFAVAASDSKNIDIIADDVEVVSIAEEYAHAGIKTLIEKLKEVGFGSFEKQFEKEIFNILG
ncbi:MAG: hypothetical protein WC891_04070 [Actinomycetota bacterium]